MRQRGALLDTRARRLETKQVKRDGLVIRVALAWRCSPAGGVEGERVRQRERAMRLHVDQSFKFATCHVRVSRFEDRVLAEKQRRPALGHRVAEVAEQLTLRIQHSCGVHADSIVRLVLLS